MKLTQNMTLDEVLHYGSLGELEISSSDDWKLLEKLIYAYVNARAERLIDEDRQSYDEGYEDGRESGHGVGFDEGWAACVKEYGIEE